MHHGLQTSLPPQAQNKGTIVYDDHHAGTEKLADLNSKVLIQFGIDPP